jgi:ferredoxin
MMAKVDKDTCTGCGLCVDACPDVFELAGGLAVVKDCPIPPALAGRCQDAVHGCPVNAIAFEKQSRAAVCQ